MKDLANSNWQGRPNYSSIVKVFNDRYESVKKIHAIVKVFNDRYDSVKKLWGSSTKSESGQ